MRTWNECIVVAPVLFLALGSNASALIMLNGSNATSATAFDNQISTTDLINAGQPTFVGSVSTNNSLCCGYTVAGLNDGSAVAAANVTYFSSTPSNVTFTLDTTINPLGYSVTSIRNFNGFTSNAVTYANQTFDILYSTVAAPNTFLPLTTVLYTPFGPTDTGAGSTVVTLTDSNVYLATGVAKIQIQIPQTIGGNGETAVFREFEVFGEATFPVPEPSTFALLGLGVIGLALKSRRRVAV